MAAGFGSDSCFALDCSPQAETPHQSRHRVADQLSGVGIVAGTGIPRQESPKQQTQATRCSSMDEKGIISDYWRQGTRWRIRGFPLIAGSCRRRRGIGQETARVRGLAR